MNLLLSDMPLPTSLPQKKENKYLDVTTLQIKHCLGCFSCWVKTPGKCIIRDDAVQVYPLIAQSERLIYVSHIYYGSYDTTMKRMLERSIPIQQAFIRSHNKETHHVQRNVVEKQATIIAYGAADEEEKALFQRYVERNAQNMMFASWRIHFVEKEDVEETIRKEVEAWEH